MKREETVDYLANLYAVVLADGVVERPEERVFEAVAREIGAGYLERKQAIARASEERLPIRLDLRWSDQIRNLEDMLLVGYCDGSLDPTEKQVIVDYAKFLGITQSQLSAVREDAKRRFAALQ